MKKKLKGLLALLMAIAMVVPMAVPAMGAISEEKYEEVKDDANYMEAYISKDEKPSSEAYYDNEYVFK